MTIEEMEKMAAPQVAMDGDGFCSAKSRWEEAGNPEINSVEFTEHVKASGIAVPGILPWCPKGRLAEYGWYFAGKLRGSAPMPHGCGKSYTYHPGYRLELLRAPEGTPSSDILQEMNSPHMLCPGSPTDMALSKL